MDKQIKKILMSRRAGLADRPVREIAQSLGALSQKWMKRSFSFRKKAVARLIKHSYFSEPMAQEVLDNIFAELTAGKLIGLLDSELGSHRSLDAFTANSATRNKVLAKGPDLIFHSFASNVPNPAIWSFVMGMLVKSANIGRLSARGQGFLDIYLDSLKNHDQLLAKTNALIQSKADASRCLVLADLTVAYGGDDTISAFQKQIPANKKFVGYGHKLSCALIGKEALLRKNIKKLALATAKDIWVCNRQGCLSPAAIFIEKGGETGVADFMQALAFALEQLSKKRERSAGHLFAEQKFKHRLQMLALKRSKQVIVRTRNGWNLVLDPSRELALTPDSTVCIKPLNKTGDIFLLIKPFSVHLQAVSLEVSAQKREKLSRQLAEAGFNRVTRAGKLQTPPLEWHHDGGFNLAGWVKWTDLES